MNLKFFLSSLALSALFVDHCTCQGSNIRPGASSCEFGKTSSSSTHYTNIGITLRDEDGFDQVCNQLAVKAIRACGHPWFVSREIENWSHKDGICRIRLKLGLWKSHHQSLSQSREVTLECIQLYLNCARLALSTSSESWKEIKCV